MAGLAQIAMGTLPVAGGALLVVAASQLGVTGPDPRATIKQDLELLEQLPAELTDRRGDILRDVGLRIDDLIAASEKSRSLREAASSYKGNWRDVVLFVCVLLFAVIWWDLDHSKSNWLPVFIVLILLAVLAASYAVRGLLRSVTGPQRTRTDRHDRS
jgi:hypothetical protein